LARFERSANHRSIRSRCCGKLFHAILRLEVSGGQHEDEDVALVDHTVRCLAAMGCPTCIATRKRPALPSQRVAKQSSYRRCSRLTRLQRLVFRRLRRSSAHRRYRCPERRLGFKYSNTICAYVSGYRAIGTGCTAACESVSAWPQALCGTVNAAPALGRIRQSLQIVTPSACQSSLTMCSGVSERGGCEYSWQASRSGFSRYEFPCVAARCARHRRARDSDARRQSNQCAAYRARSSHALSS